MSVILGVQLLTSQIDNSRNSNPGTALGEWGTLIRIYSECAIKRERIMQRRVNSTLPFASF